MTDFRAASQQALTIALIALLADEREGDPQRTSRRKTEVLLSDAGLSPAQIGPILGKRPDTVRVAIARARQEGSEKKKPSVKPDPPKPADG